MKTLNRPMFKYGGPIKEGVMSGIREPKRKGGSMGEPQAINTVGSPLSPMSSDGRANYAAPLIPIGMGIASGIARAAPLALRYGRLGINKLKNLFGRTVYKPDVGTKIATGKNKDPFTPIKKVFEPNQTGVSGYLMRSPEAKFLTGAGGTISKYASKALTGAAKSPLTIGGITLGFTDAFPTGKPFGPDKYLPNVLGQRFDEQGNKIPGTGIFNDKIKPKPTDDEAKVLTDAEKIAMAEQKKARMEGAKLAKEKFAAEQKAKRIEGYRKIMDIEGMQKDAAYDSLIAASKAVTSDPDFKGSIKDGSLINKIIGSTSKAFDKPKATEQAINSLILKGEIQKDLKKEDKGSQYQAAKNYSDEFNVDIGQAYKNLGFDKSKNLSENVLIANKANNSTTATTDTILEGVRLTYEGVVPQVVITDAELIDAKTKGLIKKDATDIKIFEDEVKNNKLGPGIYVVNKSVFAIDDNNQKRQLR